MKSNGFSLKQRFTVIIIFLGILVSIFMATAVNQIKKIKSYHNLGENALLLLDHKNDIDSLQKVLFFRLPYDVLFFKTQKNSLINKLNEKLYFFEKGVNNVTGSFYLINNKNIQLKKFEISQSFRKYKENLNKYQELLLQKGYDSYGINGQILLLYEEIKKIVEEQRNDELLQKINEINALREQYIRTKDLSYLNKLKITNF